jgi:hypothetical protein
MNRKEAEERNKLRGGNDDYSLGFIEADNQWRERVKGLRNALIKIKTRGKPCLPNCEGYDLCDCNERYAKEALEQFEKEVKNE